MCAMTQDEWLLVSLGGSLVFQYIYDTSVNDLTHEGWICRPMDAQRDPVKLCKDAQAVLANSGKHVESQVD